MYVFLFFFFLSCLMMPCLPPPARSPFIFSFPHLLCNTNTRTYTHTHIYTARPRTHTHDAGSSRRGSRRTKLVATHGASRRKTRCVLCDMARHGGDTRRITARNTAGASQLDTTQHGASQRDTRRSTARHTAQPGATHLDWTRRGVTRLNTAHTARNGARHDTAWRDSTRRTRNASRHAATHGATQSAPSASRRETRRALCDTARIRDTRCRQRVAACGTGNGQCNNGTQTYSRWL
jgi:hypothetical protein